MPSKLFPIGLYSSLAPTPTQFSLEEVAAAGFNLVSISGTVAELDQLERHSLKGIVYLGDTLDLSTDADRRKKLIEQKVKALAAHPAMGVWESINEPSWTYSDYKKNRVSAKGLETGHKTLKELDPIHPILVTHAPHQLVATLREYSQGVDLVSTAFYPVIPKNFHSAYGLDSFGFHGDLPNQSPSAVGEYTEKTKRVAGPSREVWTTLQAFAWEFDRPPNARDPELVQFPTWEELRFMSFNAITHGATGLLFWGMHHSDPAFSFWDDLRRVTREISSLAPILNLPIRRANIVSRYLELGYSNEGAVEFFEIENNGEFFLLAINTSCYPTHLECSGWLPATRKKTISVYGEQRLVEVVSNSFVEQFAGLEVRVYVCS